MRGGFRIRKKQLKQAGWQVVEESKAADGEYQLSLQQSNGEKVTIKGSTRAKAYVRAGLDLLHKVGAQISEGGRGEAVYHGKNNKVSL